MNRLAVITATLYWEGWGRCVESHFETAKHPYTRRIIGGLDVMGAYQKGFEESPEPIHGYIHDDLIINEVGWDERVLREFDDPSVGAVGFGGGTGFGSPDLYTSPYKLSNLGRTNFLSNMRDAEQHGRRFTGECDVAVLDGFAMFVRREVLEQAINCRFCHHQHPIVKLANHSQGKFYLDDCRCGCRANVNDNHRGWPQNTPIGYFCYDLWLGAEVRRQGLRTRLVGVACDHIGFRSSSMVQLTDSHAEAHKWLYENFRDVLPFQAEAR